MRARCQRCEGDGEGEGVEGMDDDGDNDGEDITESCNQTEEE